MQFSREYRRTNPSRPALSAHAVALAIPRQRPTTQPSPAASAARRQPFDSARHSSMRAKPMKLLGLNLAIPFAVRSGGSCSGFAVPALVSLACAAKPLEAELRAFEAARHRFSGRFRARKLVGSSRYSKCFFAGAQCPAIMALSGFRSRLSWRRARVAYPTDRYVGGRIASPACANNAPTAAAWPAPNSTTRTPPGASKARRIARRSRDRQSSPSAPPSSAARGSWSRTSGASAAMSPIAI